MTENRGGSKELAEASSRRRFIKLGLMAAGSMIVPGTAMAALMVVPKQTRSLSFYNLHTGESLKTVYFEKGAYVQGALDEINYILRDFRQNEIKPIDRTLLDLLVRIRERLGTDAPFQVISGYRSPKTNAMLHAHSEGVARHSLHIDGRAIDIRVPDRSLLSLRRTAISLFSGGVGYYPKSDFVHVDTGRIRYW